MERLQFAQMRLKSIKKIKTEGDKGIETTYAYKFVQQEGDTIITVKRGKELTTQLNKDYDFMLDQFQKKLGDEQK